MGYYRSRQFGFPNTAPFSQRRKSVIARAVLAYHAANPRNKYFSGIHHELAFTSVPMKM
jgi:hypothetical protein